MLFIMKQFYLPKIPKIASMREVQRNYRTLFDWVEETKNPLVLTSNSRLKVVIIPIETYQKLADIQESRNDEFASVYKNTYQKNRVHTAVNTIKQLAKDGNQTVGLSQFVIKDRENH